MDITSEVLNEIYRNLRTEFQAKIGAYKPGVDLSMLAQQVPSAGRSNLYPWLDLNYRGWKKWEGARVVKTGSASKYELVNAPYEDTFFIPVSDIEDDNAGAMPLFGDMIGKIATGWQELVYGWQIKGLVENQAAFDGVPIIGEHKITVGKKEVSIVNKAAAALSATTFSAAFAAAAGWKDPDGMPCRTLFTHVFFGPAMHDSVYDIVKVQQISGTTNKNYNRVQCVETDLLSGDDANKVILADCSKQIKPTIVQVRKPGEVIMTKDPEKVLDAGGAKVLGYGRGAYGVTLPTLVYGFGF